MGRKRIDLGAEAEAQIAALVTKGASAAEVAHVLGVSTATAKRRIRELKGKARPPGAPAIVAAAPLDAAAEPDVDATMAYDVPPDTTIAQIDEWLAVARQRAERAASADNPKAHAEYMRMIIALLEARRKAAPIPKVDPNDNPDLVAAAARVRERWHTLADSLVRVSKSPIASTIARIVSEKKT